MPENIFGIDVGQVKTSGIPSGGGPSSGLGGAGGGLNSLIRFQQKMFEIEARKQEQALANKNALFGSLTKSLGLGANANKEFFGYTPNNLFEANAIKGVEEIVSKSINGLAGSEGRAEDYAAHYIPIRDALYNPDFLAAGRSNKIVNSAVDRIKTGKYEVHPLYQKEYQKYTNAESLGDYDINVLSNPDSYKVTPIDIDEDIDYLSKRGITYKIQEDPASGQVIAVMSQDNLNQTANYAKEKYGNNYGLDYDFLVSEGDKSVEGISREEYVNAKAQEYANNLGIKEIDSKITNTLGESGNRFEWEKRINTREEIEQAKQKAAIDIAKSKEIEANKTREMGIREAQEKYAPSKVFAPARNKGGGLSSGIKNPWKSGTKPIHIKVFDDLDDWGIITLDNVDDVTAWIDGEIKAPELDKLDGNAREAAMKDIYKRAKIKFAPQLGSLATQNISGLKGKTPDGKSMEVTISGSDETFDLKDNLEGTIKGGKKIGLTATRPGFGLVKTDKAVSTRFVPEKEFDNDTYGGHVYTTNPNLVPTDAHDDLKGTEVPAEEANAAIGEDVFKSGTKVYKIPATTNSDNYGLLSAEVDNLANITKTLESDGNYSAENPASSAYGAYQFTVGTGFEIAKELGLVTTIEEYNEKKKDEGFQDKLFEVQAKRLQLDVATINKIFSDFPNKYEKAKTVIARVLGKDNITKIPEWILYYLRHHQGSIQSVMEYLEDLGGTKDLEGLEKVLRKGFRLYKYGGPQDVAQQKVLADSPEEMYKKQTGKKVADVAPKTNQTTPQGQGVKKPAQEKRKIVILK